MEIGKIAKDNYSFKIGEDGTIISSSKDLNARNGRFWILSVISVIIIITALIIWFFKSKDTNDIFLMGLKGDIESINEVSDYYMYNGNIAQEISQSDLGLFDGNIF